MKKFYPLVAVSSGGIFLSIDQALKWWAKTNPTLQWYLFKPWLGWEYFSNPGVAFGLPLPNTLVVAITPVILFLIAYWLWQTPTNHRKLAGLALLLSGAISNYIDRLWFGVTIDYLRILYSIINLGDVAIVVGAFILVLSKTTSPRLRPNHSHTPDHL